MLTEYDLCKKLDFAKELLLKKQVLVVNTETVFGLIGILDDEVKLKIYDIKSRSFKKPLTLFFSDLSILNKYVYIDKDIVNGLKRFWPGQLTVIFKAKLDIFSNSKLAFRMPACNCLLNLISEFEVLFSTSANISNYPPCYDVSCIYKQFKNRILNVFIDKEVRPSKLPSTIIDISEGIENIKLIRQGSISFEKIKEVFF